MIVVTGAAGFIGSALLGVLEEQGYGSLVAVDDFDNPSKSKNLKRKNILQFIPRDDFMDWMKSNWLVLGGCTFPLLGSFLI